MPLDFGSGRAELRRQWHRSVQCSLLCLATGDRVDGPRSFAPSGKDLGLPERNCTFHQSISRAIGREK